MANKTAFDEAISKEQYDELMGMINNLSEEEREFVAKDMRQKGLKLKELPQSQYVGFKNFLIGVKGA